MRERLTHYGPSPSKVGVCRRGSEDGEEVLRGDGDQGDAIGTGLDLSPGPHPDLVTKCGQSKPSRRSLVSSLEKNEEAT